MKRNMASSLLRLLLRALPHCLRTCSTYLCTCKVRLSTALCNATSRMHLGGPLVSLFSHMHVGASQSHWGVGFGVNFANGCLHRHQHPAARHHQTKHQICGSLSFHEDAYRATGNCQTADGSITQVTINWWQRGHSMERRRHSDSANPCSAGRLLQADRLPSARVQQSVRGRPRWERKLWQRSASITVLMPPARQSW